MFDRYKPYYQERNVFTEFSEGVCGLSEAFAGENVPGIGATTHYVTNTVTS